MPNKPDPKPRTVDQRLDGLTQTVEIIGAMQRDNEERFAANEKRFAALAGHIEGLVRVAELHHERVTRLEDRQQ